MELSYDPEQAEALPPLGEQYEILPAKAVPNTKLTPETQLKILNAMRCGASRRTAAAAAGIAYDTFKAWIFRSKQQDADPVYVAFARNVEAAKDEGIVSRLAIIQNAARDDWRAAAWLLEREDPERFSMKFKVEHSAGVSLQDLIGALNDSTDDDSNQRMLPEPSDPEDADTDDGAES